MGHLKLASEWPWQEVTARYMRWRRRVVESIDGTGASTSTSVLESRSVVSVVREGLDSEQERAHLVCDEFYQEKLNNERKILFKENSMQIRKVLCQSSGNSITLSISTRRTTLYPSRTTSQTLRTKRR